MTKPLQGSHFRGLRDLIMGMTKVEKSNIPIKIKNTYTMTKKDNQAKVKHPKGEGVRRETTVKPESPTGVALLAQ